MKFFLTMAIVQVFCTFGFADEARYKFNGGGVSIKYVCFRTDPAESYGQCASVGLFLMVASAGGPTVKQYVLCPTTLTACLPVADLANKSLLSESAN